MLQSGELDTEKRTEFILEVIKEIKEKTGHGENGLGIALSLGEYMSECETDESEGIDCGW